MTDPGPLSGQRALSSKAANDRRSPASHRTPPSRSPTRRKEAFDLHPDVLDVDQDGDDADLVVLRASSAGDRSPSAWLIRQGARLTCSGYR
jgi:hypothetical protein